MRVYFLSIFFVFLFSFTFSQNDFPVVKDLGDSSYEAIENTFPTIQVYNFPTTDVLNKGVMKLYLAHRMGQIGTGIDGLYGLYTANSRIGADLGLIKNITIGLGSTSQQKLYDGYIKVLLIRQCKQKFPLTISLFSDAALSLQDKNYPKAETYAWQKLSYTSELMLSRLFNNRFAAQIMFAVVHRNMVASKEDENSVFATGITADYKTGRKIHLAFEYVYLPQNQIKSINVSQHIISVGIQIHSGPRHVFQIFLSNSSGINEGKVITETTDNFRFKHVRICFNIPTTFHVYH